MKDSKQIIQNLPQKPGVYRFFDKERVLLYIGKAKNLKNRVSSYFQQGRPHNERLTLMINRIDKIEYTVVESEKESLLLEANLINNLKPKYNVLLKDDKSYTYIRISNDPIPGVFLTRKKFDPKSLYFGPYTSKRNVLETIRTIRSIFPFCQEKKPQKRPCSYVGIKQCEGICIKKENIEDYKEKIKQIGKVLSGKTEEAELFLQEKMQTAVKKEDYALASLWRDRLQILQDTIQSQKIILPEPQDLDIITLAIEENEKGLQIGSIFVQNIRDGKMINLSNFLLSGTEEGDDKDIVMSFLKRFMNSYYNYKTDEAEVLVQSFILG